MPIVLRWLLRLGPTNPIAVRLVSNGSRRSRHHYIRIAYLGSLILVLLYALLFKAAGDQLDYRQLAAAGSLSFQYIAYLQIAFICILAPVFMAGAIEQEADPKTWDVLLTTPLGAGEIVLGNLFGRLFFILALLLSSLPLFAVTQYFGGVEGKAIFASYIISSCAALLVGAMAICLSVSRLAGRRAVFAFYISVVSYLVITIAIDATTRAGGVTWMTAINPFLAVNALIDTANYAPRPDGTQTGLAYLFLETPVMTWCVLSLLVSLLLIVVSVITVRIGGLAGLGVGSTLKRRAPWYGRLVGLRNGQDEIHRAPRGVWSNPIAWREAAGRNATLARIISRWMFIVAGILFGVILIVMLQRGGLSPSAFRSAVFFTVIGELGIISLVAINMAAISVSREREDGTLDILLTTPIQAAQYLSGKLQGMIAYLLPMIIVPVTTLGLAGFYVAIGGIGQGAVTELTVAITGRTGGGGTMAVPLVLPESIIILPLVAVPFIAFCVVIGMMWSLKMRGTTGSVMATVGVVSAVAGTVGLCAWNAGASLPKLGPVLSALSPASTVYSLVFPEFGMSGTYAAPDPIGARVGLAIGAVVSAAVHMVIVYSLRASMVRNFDMTVRKLAGTK